MTKKIKDKSVTSMLVDTVIEKLASKKNQRELAREIGFVTGNMLSMIKNDEVKVPFAKIPRIAEVLEIDPALLIRFCLAEQWPDHEAVVYDVFRGILTEAERGWMEFFAEVGVIQPPTDPGARKQLADLLMRAEWCDSLEE